MASRSTGRLQALSTTAGRHRIDDGLYLYVRNGARPIWVYRYVGTDGKRRDMSIGRFESISLPDARAEILRWNAERKEGRDPIDIRKSAMEQAEKASRAAVTLREYATEYHALRLPTWKNDKHAAQWLSSLNHLGKLLALPLPEITSANLLEVEPQRGTGWDWIFPSPQGRRECLSNGALLGVLRRMGLAGKATGHDMRASFSTWAYENTQFRSEIIESAMSHQEEDAVKKAYNRATYWDQRVELAEAWSAFCLQRTK